MAKNDKKNNKGLIIGICCGVVALIIAIVLIVIFVVKPGGLGGSLSDAYFVSDDTKLVMTLDSEQASFEDEEYAPAKSHMVYYYSGDKVTGMSVFYEYGDEATAKLAYDHIDDDARAEAKEIKIRGKYIEVVMKEDSYSEATPEEVKQQIEFMEMLKNMNFDDETSDDGLDEDDYEEEGEEEDEEEVVEDEEMEAEEDF